MYPTELDMRVHRWASLLLVERLVHRTVMFYPSVESGMIEFEESVRAPGKRGIGVERPIGAALMTHAEGEVLAEWGDWSPIGSPVRPGSENYYPLIEGVYASSTGIRRRYYHRLANRGLRDKSFIMDRSDPEFYVRVEGAQNG